MNVKIIGKVGDSAAADVAGKVEFSQATRFDNGGMLVTGATAVARITDGELKTTTGEPFTLPVNPEGTAVRIREVLWGATYEWWAAVPDVEEIAYQDLPRVESSQVPESVFWPPRWLTNFTESLSGLAQDVGDKWQDVNQARGEVEIAKNTTVAARDEAVTAANSVDGVADAAITARDQAELFAASTVELQDGAVAALAADTMSRSRTELDGLYVGAAGVGRLVAVPEGAELPTLVNGDLVVRYAPAGKQWVTTFEGEPNNTPVQALTHFLGTENWVTRDSDSSEYPAGAENSVVAKIAVNQTYYWLPDVSADADSDTVEVVFRYRHGGATQNGPHVLLTSDSSRQNATLVDVNGAASGYELRANRYTGGTFSSVDYAPRKGTAVADTWRLYRVRVEGEVVKAKYWFDGEPEPTDWDLESYLPSTEPRVVAIGRSTTQGIQYLDWVSWATGGKPAVRP